VVLDCRAFGGQAGASASIENYLGLSNDEHVGARSVVVASGARYRRIDVENLERSRHRVSAIGRLPWREALRRAGGCPGGGGNSAGQAAGLFGKPGRQGLGSRTQPRSGVDMLRYLVDCIAGLAKVEMVTQQS
jgi:thioredoxin reductase (NADPH)